MSGKQYNVQTLYITSEGVRHIKSWEGLRLEAYKDQAGIWTIGYGHTAKAGGIKPVKGMKITAQQAHDQLMSDIGLFERELKRSVKVPLTQGQYNSLIGFMLNIGDSAFRSSTLLKKLNAGDYDAIPAEIRKWDKVTVNGQKVRSKGLTNRRAAEAVMWGSTAVGATIVVADTVDALPDVDTVIDLGTQMAQGGAGWAFYAGAALLAIGAGFLIYKIVKIAKEE